MKEATTGEPKADHFEVEDPTKIRAPGWLKVGALAAASALAGGLAAAWFYRKTLARLRQAEAEQSVPETILSGDDSDFEI